MRTILIAAAAALVLGGCASAVDGTGTLDADRGGVSSSGAPATRFPSPSPTVIAGRTPAELVAAITAATRSAHAFRLTGHGSDPELSLTVDIHYGATSSSGSMVVDGAAVSFREVGGAVYLKASDTFWRRSAGAEAADPAFRDFLRLIKGKYVRLTAGTPGGAEIRDLTDRRRFLEGVSSATGSKDFVAGPSAVIGGVPAVSVVESTGGSTLYVPAKGRPYPLRVTTADSRFDFTAWNVPFSVSAPPSAQVVKLPG